MKISQIFNLNKTQHELDFVDIDISKDKRVFLDPFFISTRVDPWCIKADTTLKKFFQLAIDLIKINKTSEARTLFIHLNEPNETCLGISKGNPKGRGVDYIQAKQIFDSITKSKAVKTGLVEDLEDTAIFIENIDRDKVSDMTTNIIKKHLIDYTKDQCFLLDIRLTPDVPTGYYWDENLQKWNTSFDARLVINNKAYLLVPKIAVSFYKNYIAQKYYQHYVLNYLQDENLNNNSSLVRIRRLKSGFIHKFVTKKDIKESQAPYSKDFLREFTKRHPIVFQNFRKETSTDSKPILSKDLESINIHELIDYLIEQLHFLKPGGDDAAKYHSLMIGILELIFYPNLTKPKKEKEINEGRKRIDITFDNSATRGYFYRLHDIHKITSRYIFMECKNYTNDLTNPELDQLSGRFSVNSSRCGLLICRSIQDQDIFLKRCQDYWKQKQELILPITDDDIVNVLNAMKEGNPNLIEEILTEIQRKIIIS